MATVSQLWQGVWARAFDHRGKLTATGAFVLGIVLTLGLKDFYPDLELAYQRRARRLQVDAPLPTGSAPTIPKHVVHLEDHTGFSSSHDNAPPADPILLAPPIASGVEGLIGNTPLIQLRSLSAMTGCEILAKAELLNGAGNSPKDRVALSIITYAEEAGLLVPGRGDIIFEGTVGSTGISLAAVARARGYRAHICMPSDVSSEKSSLLLKLGAQVERVPPASIIDQEQFVNAARRRAQEYTADVSTPGHGFFADQFENTANYLAHQSSTGPEIYAQCNGSLDAFIAGAGTGGTLSGVSLHLKPLLPNLHIVLADPQGSGLYNKIKYGVMFSATEAEGTRRRHQVDSVIEGVGINRMTANFEAGMHLIDDAVKVSDRQAMMMARWIMEKEGLFLGASSCVNLIAAAVTARKLGPGKRIVTIICDSGTRHLSKFWQQAGEVGDTNQSFELDDILEAA